MHVCMCECVCVFASVRVSVLVYAYVSVFRHIRTVINKENSSSDVSKRLAT